MSSDPRRVAVVGYGMAGARFAEEVRRHDPDARRVQLTVFGAEPHRAYNRVLLSAALAGGLDPDDLYLHGPDWALRHQVDVRCNVGVRAVEPAGRHLVLDDGTVVGYDDLVLATGSQPWLPPVDGLTTAYGELAGGVTAFRDLDDCRALRAAAGQGRTYAVLGGGLLGLEAARGLAASGADVTVVHPVGHLMERQLDVTAGRLLHDQLTGLGVQVRLSVTATGWLPGHGLELSDGSWLGADSVVVSAGVRARTSLARRARLAVERGVVVDDRLTTSDPHIHAIGDCAQHRGETGALVQPAWEQAAVLAARLTGADPAATYEGTPVVTRLKASNLDLTSLGEAHADNDEHTEAVRLEDPRRGRYGKLVLREDRVVGAIMLGLPDAAANIVRLYDAGDPAPADRMALLLGRAMPAEVAPALPAPKEVVCHCNTVTMGRLTEAWQAGACTTADLTTATRATTGCGGCRSQVEAITVALEEAERKEAAA
ncbi:MAG: NAD(P)/FAD-dependent oxidoreductase [Streptosporangiales bacterium]|nr:NAD(P)/FAD-dependent oxidoreductase [Streptosporangiales bacterium]